MGSSAIRNRPIAIGFATLLASSAVSSLAWAQDQVAAPSAAAGTVAPADIIVTAQRRTERLQDVPISVSVLTPQLNNTQAITTTLDIQKAVPGLIFTQRNLNGLPVIRGIGAENTAGGDEPSVALYVDGVYRASSAASTFALPNVERIEVLKGPQGTLFGRNATGGVINITTKDPSPEFAGQVSAGYANYDTFTGTAYLTGPITSNLSANIAGRYQKRANGWGTNVGTGNDVYTLSSGSLAGKLKLDLGTTVATLGADWSRDRWTGGPGQPLGNIPGRGNSVDGQPYYAGFYNINSEVDSVLRARNYGVNLTVEHDFGNLLVRSISAYRGTKSFLFADADATPVWAFNFTSDLNERTFTQEAQILAEPGSQIQWIVGAYYLRTRSELGPQMNILPSGTTSNFQLFHTTSLALYAQATVPLAEGTNLTVGGRYTIDEKQYENTSATGVVTVLPDRTYKSPTWRLALDHKFTDDLMVYGSYNRGFKSGAYGAGTLFPAVSPATVDAFEAGFKSQFLDRRVTLNVAAFYSKYKNIQISTTVISGASSFLQLLNAAAARTQGVDAELTVYPAHDLRLSASASYLDAKYTEWLNAPLFLYAPNNFGLIRSVFDASGRKMNNAPSLAATLSASYVVHSGFGDVELTGSDSYVSKYYNTVDHLQASQSRHLIGASAEWFSPGRAWSVRIWGANLANEKYYDVVVPNAFQNRVNPGAPRTYGITATANF